MRLKDKTAIITGGACGIGRCTAETFLHEGANVIIADVNEKAGAGAVQELHEYAAKICFRKTDVTQESEVENLIKSAENKFGKLDILVNNAGITLDAQLIKMEMAQWDKVIDINLKGAFLCGQAAARQMIGQGHGGVILNASSVVGLYGNFGQSNYVASKAGVIGLTKTWARELGRKGIRVNAVAPGFIATEMVQSIPEKVIEMMKNKTPLARLGQPRDIADAYLFLASDEASFITGITLSVDGGLVA